MGFEEDIFKLSLKLFFQKAEVITESDVPSSNLRIDLLVLKDKDSVLRYPFDFMEPYRVIVSEYKSSKDILLSQSIASLVSKGMLLFTTALKGKKFQKKKEEVQSRLMSARKITDYCLLLIVARKKQLGKKAFEAFPNCCDKEMLSPGIYLFHRNTDFTMDFYVMVLEELPLTVESRLFHFLAFPEKRVALLREAIRDNDEFMYTLGLYLDKELVLRLAETSSIKLKFSKKGIREATEVLGLEKVIDAVGLEKVIEAVGLEKVIEAIGLEKIIQTMGLASFLEYLIQHPEELKKAMKNLSPEKREKLKKLLE